MVLDPRLFEEEESPRVFTSPRVTTSLAEPQELPPLPPEPSTAQRIGAALQRFSRAFEDVPAAMRGEPAATYPSVVRQQQQNQQTQAGLAILTHIKGMYDQGATPEQLRALKSFYNHALQSVGMPDASALIDSFIENPSNIGDFLKLYPVLQGRLTQQQLLQLRRDKTGTVLPRLLADVKPLAGEEALKQLDTALRTWTTQGQDVTTLNENALRGFFPNLEYAKPDRVDQTLAQYGITPGSVALSAAKEAAVEAERIKRPTPSDRDAALLVTGRNIKSFDELSATERADVLLYKDAPKDLQVEINSLKKASPEKSITDLYDQAKQNLKSTQIEIAGAKAESRIKGTERGLQTVISERLDRLRKEEEARMGGRPLEAADRAAITAMTATLKATSMIKQEFTPEELNKYIGIFTKSAREIAQVVNKDPRFARLNALVNTVRGAAFSEGGKQLTPFEASITFGHVPTGTEFSVVDFLAKIDVTVEMTEDQIRNRYKLAQTPRSQLIPPSSQSTIPSAGNSLRGQHTNKPDGQYRLPDGTIVTVKGGIIQ